MLRSLVYLSGLFSVVLVACFGIALTIDHANEQRIYTVAEVRAHLARNPGVWLGRTMLVRGEIVPCLVMPSADNGLCAALAPPLWQPAAMATQNSTPVVVAPRLWQSDPGAPAAPAAIDPLPVVRVGLDPFLAQLRRLPLLGHVLPAPQVLHWGAVATYRVQLRAVAHSICGGSVCFEAALLDATPDSL